MKTSFYGSRSVQVKSIKDWNYVIDKTHFTTEDFMKCSEVIKKNKKYPSVNEKYPYNYSRQPRLPIPFCFYLKRNPSQFY